MGLSTEACNTFCVGRHHLKRAFSQFNFRPGFNNYCTEDGARRYFNKLFKDYEHDPMVDDCHFIPQTEYVFGMKSPGSPAGNRTCHHVIHFENLTAEFDALMRAYDMPFRL